MKPLCWSGFCFLLGAITSMFLHAFLSPVIPWFEEMGENVICRVPYLCSSHQTFKASLKPQCQVGNVGRLIDGAIRVGDLVEHDTNPEHLARRAYLCVNGLSDRHEQEGKKSIEHLKFLAKTFKGCFTYSSTEEIFSVKTGRDSDACVTKIDKNKGYWQEFTNYSMGRVFCFPGNGISRNGSLTDHNLFPCTNEELLRIGMPNEVLPK